MDQAGRLHGLLSEDPAGADARLAALLDWDAGTGQPLVLVGAGTLGRFVLERLRQRAIEPVAWADDTPSKRGRNVDGVLVLSVEEAARRFGRCAVWVVTIHNPAHRYLQTRRRLWELGCQRVYSCVHLMHKFADAFLPYFMFDRPSRLLAEADRIEAAFALLSDRESRKQFVDLLQFRLRLDHEVIPPKGDDNYFPASLLTLPDDVTFVDCGAFTGDTIERFLRVQGNRFARIIALEPDETNFVRLREFVGNLDGERQRKVLAYRAAVGSSRRRERFDGAGNMGASFSAQGSTEVEVLPLDELLTDGRAAYVKLDVEGAEMDALEGGRRTLARTRPGLAVCVYHRPRDLWDVILYLRDIAADYRFFLRTEGPDGMDVVCYARAG